MQVDAKAEVQGQPIGATVSPPVPAPTPLSAHGCVTIQAEIRLQNSVYKMYNWQTSKSDTRVFGIFSQPF